MEKKFNILHLEEDVKAAELFQRALKEANIPCRVVLVTSEQSFVNALSQMRFDLIVSDESHPSFGAKPPAEVARETSPLTPVILLSGKSLKTGSEESSSAGVDIVPKANLAKLIPAVRRSLLDP